MLSNGFDVPLRLKLRPSKLLFQFQVLMHGLALLALMLPSSLLFEIKFMLVVILIIHLAFVTRRYRQQLNSNEQLIWQKGDLWISLIADSVTSWNCLSNTLVKAWFVIVNLSNENGNRTLLIVKDQCDALTFRRLKVRLKYFQGEAAMPTDAS